MALFWYEPGTWAATHRLLSFSLSIFGGWVLSCKEIIVISGGWMVLGKEIIMALFWYYAVTWVATHRLLRVYFHL